MRGLNTVTLIGNLGSNPEIQKLQGDVNVAKFSLATTESFKDTKGLLRSTTDWHTIILWWGLADLAEKYLRKGSLIYLEGKLKTRVSDTPTNRRLLGLAADPVGKEALSYIHPANQGALQRLIETLQLKVYIESIIRTYRNEFAQLLYVRKSTLVDSLDAERLRSYFLYCTTTLKLSENTCTSDRRSGRINAVKFFFEQELHRERLLFEIPRPKKRIILPNVLAISQVERLFAQLENLKHKTMLYLAYSAGLRVSEVVNMKV